MMSPMDGDLNLLAMSSYVMVTECDGEMSC